MMMLLLLSFVAMAMAQNLVLDRVEGYSVEYDDQHNIVLLVGSTACYIVEATDARWDPIVRSREELHAAALGIIRVIESNTGLTDLTQREAIQAYGSRLESLQCSLKKIYRVRYTPHFWPVPHWLPCTCQRLSGGIRRQANIVLLTNAENCYIVEAPDAAWDSIGQSSEDLQNAGSAILEQVGTNTGVTSLTAAQASSQYQSLLERTQCFGKSIYKVSYSPRT
ncbi:uncharacterized protein LOC112575783 [Pomacea canaliculata]|uniref:uncharacterized protein LOC112575783 n=1 Tax=Pomacea canaliculata TaxID=400727 RepID=UPI000D730FEA|nr:uncharacterized protein LOC112575783 [Pomacea canaliculata]